MVTTRLFDAHVDEQLIMSRTGHSSTKGVRSYKRISEQLQEDVSDILNAKCEVKKPAFTPSSLIKDLNNQIHITSSTVTFNFNAPSN